MSSWDTNPWSNFYDPHWELICLNKWHPGTSEISTPTKIAIGMHFYVWTWHQSYAGIFTWWWRSLLVATCKFGLLTIRQHSATKKTPIPVSSRWQVRPQKAKKGEASTLVTATTSVHLPEPALTDLTIKPDPILTNPIGKNGVQSWSI